MEVRGPGSCWVSLGGLGTLSGPLSLLLQAGLGKLMSEGSFLVHIPQFN